MKALKIEPGKAPERIDIGNELEALQDAVGGYIQVLYPDQHRPVGLICNEEGKCMGLKPNRALYRGGKPSQKTSSHYTLLFLHTGTFPLKNDLS